MTRLKKILSDTGATVKGLVKLALLARPCHLPRLAAPDESLVILANGPSLADNISSGADRAIIEHAASMAVNFAANAPEFMSLRPRYYVLADPHFFTSGDANVGALWRNLTRVDWTMTLFVPRASLTAAGSRLGAAHSSVSLQPFNFVGIEGFGAFRRTVYRRALGMPRPRNVLIPSIMLGMAVGYRKIVLLGADHSWMRTLSVTDDNEVVSVQPHFYKDDDSEKERVRHEYRGYRLHDIVGSFAVAFRSYHDIAAYARAEGVDIVNSTPGSFIDAFRRAPLGRAIGGDGQSPQS